MITPSDALPVFLAERIATHSHTLSFREPFAEWQGELRNIWRASLPPSGILRYECLNHNSNRRHLRMHYATGDSGDAILIVPEENGPHPAVILMHDHGGIFDIGWQKMASDEAGKAHVAQHYDGHFLADDLVERGYAVLICDALGWGSRFAGGYHEQQALAAQTMQAGWSLAGLVAADDLAAFEWLSRQSEIDPTRIGTLGFSFGGFRAWQLAALEQRTKTCAAVCWAGTRRGLLMPGATLLKGQSAFYTLHPDLAAFADFPDMAALAADRPLFMRVGSQDRHFPEVPAEQFFDVVRKAGLSTGTAPDMGLFPCAHRFPLPLQEMAASYLDRHLGCPVHANV
ncbi:dienelactone hydrolase family protein [Agrobacterium sp. rho-8.1]|nr:dienelactone hydrolase family protein [Agrobacterium sp. rho-8.1]